MDHLNTVLASLLIGGFLALPLVFIVFARQKRQRYERIEQLGASRFLGKSAMEMGYWAIQPVARGLVALGISPDAISWASLAVGLGAAVAVGARHLGLGAAMLLVAALLDALDGLVARLTHQQTEAGYVLDSHLDRYVELFFFGGLLFYYEGRIWLQALVCAALLGSYMVSYATLMARFKSVAIAPGSVPMRRAERMIYLIAGTGVAAISVRWFEGATVAGAPTAYPLVLILALIAGVANVSAVALLFRMMAALRAQRPVLVPKPATKEPALERRAS